MYLCVLLGRKNVFPAGLGAVAAAVAVDAEEGVAGIPARIEQIAHVFENKEQCNNRLEQLRAAKQANEAPVRGGRGGNRGNGGNRGGRRAPGGGRK